MMKRQYERLATRLGYDLGFGIQHKLSQLQITGIARRQAKILWPQDTKRAVNLQNEFIGDVVWHSGINHKEEE